MTQTPGMTVASTMLISIIRAVGVEADVQNLRNILSNISQDDIDFLESEPVQTALENPEDFKNLCIAKESITRQLCEKYGIDPNTWLALNDRLYSHLY